MTNATRMLRLQRMQRYLTDLVHLAELVMPAEVNAMWVQLSEVKQAIRQLESVPWVREQLIADQLETSEDPDIQKLIKYVRHLEKEQDKLKEQA